MTIRAPKDFWAGVMFCGFAAIGILAAKGYSLGSAGKMGPGYFPLLLGIVLAAMGVNPDRQICRHRGRAGLALSHSAPRHHRNSGVPVRPYD